ncbi:MAG: ABC transporter permease [Thermoprotei archaeon]|nr:MAG: ABC transporter permease [Thermoprotei archaeon]
MRLKSLLKREDVKDLRTEVLLLKIFLKANKGFSVGLMILTIFIFFGFVLPVFSPYDPRNWGMVPPDKPPSLSHPLGTTTTGQDLFWLATYAIRNSMIIGVIGSAGGLAIGIILGLIAGYKGGITDRLIVLFADTFIVIPVLPLLILIGSLVKAQLNMPLLGLIIALITWGMPVRNIRSMVLSLREREFTYTALFSGSSTMRLIYAEYLPHVAYWILASFIHRVLIAIGLEVTLAIFGLSTLREATLGSMIYWAMQYQAILRGIWWWIATPVFIIILLFISLYLVSIGIAEYLNPRVRIQRLQAGR